MELGCFCHFYGVKRIIELLFSPISEQNEEFDLQSQTAIPATYEELSTDAITQQHARTEVRVKMVITVICVVI